MLEKAIRLGVNIDHIATLRQVRGNITSYPNLLRAAQLACEGGADQITIHLREDRRHIQDSDLVLLCKERPAQINLELAADSDVFALALKNKPDWLCFVPEKREELTTEGGLNIVASKDKLANCIKKAKDIGISSSMFIEANKEQVLASKSIGADAVEFHTGHWVMLKEEQKLAEWQRLKEAAILAHQEGLRVHAGHGLDFVDIKKIIELPYLVELNIGHSIVCHAVFEGLLPVVHKMKMLLKPYATF